MKANITLNQELNGIEISFDSKPTAATIETLKNNNFRWHRAKKLWYAKQTPERLTIAETIANGETITETETKKSVYLLTGKEKAAFIENYSFVKTAKDDGTKRQFTKGGWIDYFNKKDYIFFPRLGLAVAVDRPTIENTIYYSDEYESPISKNGENKKAVFFSYNMRNFNDFWADGWKKSKKELEETGCTTGRYNSRPAILEYPKQDENSETYIYFTSLDDNYNLKSGKAKAHEMTPEEVGDLLEIIEKLKTNYKERLERYFNRYQKNITSCGYWANR